MLSLGTVLRQRIEKIVCSFVCDLDIHEVVPAHTFVETGVREIRFVTTSRRSAAVLLLRLDCVHGTIVFIGCHGGVFKYQDGTDGNLIEHSKTR